MRSFVDVFAGSLLGVASFGTLLAVVGCHSSPPPVADSEDRRGLGSRQPAAVPDRELRFARQTWAGKVVAKPKQVTWVLDRSMGRVGLRVSCRRGRGALRLNGEETNEAAWQPAVTTEYTGVEIDAAGPSYRFTSLATSREAVACHGLDAPFTLACRAAEVAVLQRGARLVVGARDEAHELPPWHWEPPNEDHVRAWLCDVVAPEKGGAPAFGGNPVAFPDARDPARGIEWAYENSDMVVQQGAYRWFDARVVEATP